VYAWDVNKNLANGLFWIVFASTILFAAYALSFSRTKRVIGIIGVLVLLVGQSLLVWLGTRDQPFDRSGIATKCYVITRDAIIYRERSGVDPATGRECRPVTVEIAERLTAYQQGRRPARVQTDAPVFFDLRTGNPVIWFYQASDGTIELFDLMGFHPETGDELLPITKQVVELWKEQKEQEARRAPQRVDLSKYAPFDQITGKPRVWYRQSEIGDFEFYDRPGYHPQSGEALKIITVEVLNEWRERESKRCYVITRDAVLYRRDEPGIDRETGRQCRQITPQVLERLREYEKGKRPKKIEASEPEFFDPRTGDAIVWYSRGANNIIEIFDLMGFHPQTGEELLPITKDVVERWRSNKGRGVPKRVDPGQYEFFDPRTGEPRAWYWRSEKGEYEFYDNPGFHPRTGEPLLVVSKEALAKRIKEIEDQEKRRKEEEERAKQEKAKRDEENRREAAQQEEDRRKLQAERETTI
jgi:hypothetical protein